MGKEIEEKKQLGMSKSTAANRLKKELLFSLVKRLGENYCYQCGCEIESSKELSVEHKTPWLHSENPVELYFDLDNIGFSHLSCNIKAASFDRSPKKHPSITSYQNGCRCDECKTIKASENKRNRK